MSGTWQRSAWMRQWLAEGRPDYEAAFIPAGPYARKVRCRVCGSMGYPGGPSPYPPSPWQIGCLIGHQTCDQCGCPTRNKGAHQECKVVGHHGRCCNHYDTQYRALQRLLEEA